MPDKKSSWEFTEGNHLRHGWVLRDGQRTGTYFTKIGACRRVPESGFLEAQRSARHLAARSRGADLVLCLSGGVDSECMARAFLAAGVPFRVAIARFAGDLNQHDIGEAERFCRERNLAIEYVDIDVERFFAEGRHLTAGQRYQCRSPQLAVHIELLLRIDGVPVMAGNPVTIGLHGKSWPYLYLPTEPHVCLLRALALNGRRGAPFFFCDSPELIYSFWQTSQFRRDLRYFERWARWQSGWRAWLKPWWRGISPVTDRYAAKVNTYQQAGFTVRARDGKHTGFEKVKEVYAARTGRDALVAFDDLFRWPLEKMNPYPDQYLQLVGGTHFPPTKLLTLFSAAASARAPAGAAAAGRP